MVVRILKDLYQLLSLKKYGVGDAMPRSCVLSELDSFDVYKSKKIIHILNQFSSNTTIKRLDVFSNKSKVSAN